MKPLQRLLIAVLCLASLFTLGVGVRRMVLETQLRRYGADLPFTLESALYYRRVKMTFDTGRLPARDISVQYPEGVDTRRTYTTGSETVYARLARMLPSSLPVAARVRWLEVAWFCLGIPLLAIGLYAWGRQGWAAGLGAALYAVAVSSVIRSTGQELSHENFALPFLVASWAADVASRQARRRTVQWLASALSSIALGLSLASWDLIQFAVGLRFLVALGDAWRGRLAWRTTGWWRHVLDLVAMLVVGAVNVYHRGHGWVLAMPMWLGYAALAVSLYDRWRAGQPAAVVRPWVRGAVAGGVLAVGLLAPWLSPAAGAYGHFAELQWAKIRFLNHKPADPSLLNFDQRIMWVPALHSATWGLTRTLFPFMLYLTIPAALVVYAQSRKRPGEGYGRLLFYGLSSIVAFCFFARFHVFLALFAAALLGLAASEASRYGRWPGWIAALLLGGTVFAEAVHTLQNPARWGRTNVYYKELDELGDWLRRHAAPDPVLANFGVSAYIAAYGKCAIILHPKFEDSTMRDRVEAYGEQLFTGTERSFRDWADAHGAQYYVHAYGEFSRESPELQMRYFVDAMNPPDTAPARRFETGDPADLTYFRFEWGNVKYAVYRILTKAEEAMADRQALRARAALQRGDLATAELASVEALKIHARQAEALEILQHVTELRASGFRHEPAATP